MRRIASAITCWCLIFGALPSTAQVQSFRVKFVSSDVVYIEGGSGVGLKEGMALHVKRPEPGQAPLMAPTTADLRVISVASTSAACEVVRTDTPVEVGDLAYIDSQDLPTLSATAVDAPVYAQIVEFENEDPLEAEIREFLPKPPLPEVNRFTGRIGFDDQMIFDHSAAGLNSQQQGIAFRFNFTRIKDTHWSLDGYWRARLNSRTATPVRESLTDLLQRVYHFGLRYDSPESPYVAGFGRVLVPWASSLNTLDGGYLGRKIGRPTTIGLFAGTTPDPTAWNYDPNRQIGGVFASFEKGSFERARYTGTSGIAFSRLNWKPERQFLFAENGILIGRRLNLHHNLEVDYNSAARFASTQHVSLSRSFFTARVQPVPRLSFDLNHNYFRVLPTADPRLASIGLLDNILFQGLNGGARAELPYGFTVYGTAGRSRRSEDVEASWSRMGGISAKVPRTKFRADVRYSHFTGSVARGRYRSVALRNDNSERWRFELEAGDQRFDALLGSRSNSWFGMGGLDIFFGRFVLGVSGTRYRGDQNYDQFRTGLDVRF